MHGQAGIFREQTPYHYHLEFSRVSDDMAVWKSALVDLAASLKQAHESVSAVLGFGPKLARLLDISPDQSWHEFTALAGPKHQAPATQNDLWLWLHGDRYDENFATARAAATVLSKVAAVAVDVPCFVYRDSRDLSGFVDGSANPTGDARQEHILIIDGAGRGGCFAMTQQYIHNLPPFEALPESRQEKIIGRTKPDSIEFTGDDQPFDSHVSRTDLSTKLYRRSVPFGTVSEHGLYFVAFAREQEHIQIRLDRIFGLIEDGVSDRLLDFTQAQTGSYWWMPSSEVIDQLSR